MKKTFKVFALMLLTALAFSSCVDVPVPYNLPTKKGSTTIEPSGDGTLASPFNVAAIIEKISEMEANVESTEEYYIKGKVSKVSTKENDISQYGNHTFEMIDEGNSLDVFTAYQVCGPGKQKFTSVNDIRVGDEVVVCGRVVNFKGSKPETVGKGEAYVVSINGSGDSESEDEGTAITCAKAVELTNALEDGGTSTETYTVIGYITEVVGNVSKNQQTFWMADTKDGGKIFEAYWANLPEGVSEFTVGMKVKITGNLMKYVNKTTGNVTHEMKNPKVVILPDDGGQGGDVTGTEITCAQAVELTNALADGGTSTETYTVTGYITEVVGDVSKNQQTFWMADTKDGGRVFEAYWANLPEGVSAFTAGMKVKITGNLMKYVNKTTGNVTPEIKNATVVVIEEGDGGGGGDTPGGETATPEGDGTLDNPYNVAAAINYIKGLGADVTSPSEVYIKGVVKTNKTTDATISQYGNMTFTVIDRGFDSAEFQAYQVYGLGNQKFTSSSDIKVGDEVVIYGKVVNYKGNTPETTGRGSAYVYSINGQTQAGDGGGGQGGDGGGGGQGGDPVTELENGDFESWESDAEPTGWKSASPASNSTLSQNRDAHSGVFACQIAAAGSANKRLATQEMTLEAGSYTFSYYAKSTTGDVCQTKGGYVPVNADNTITEYYQYSSTYTDINNNGWTLVSYDFTLSARTTVCLIVMNPKNSTYSVAQDILVDDATLVKN